MHGLDQAAKLAARADRPAILYGPGLPADGGQRLAALDRAVFIPMETAANSRAAAALGLDNGRRAVAARVVYALLGEFSSAGEGRLAGDGNLGAPGATLVVQASYESALTHRAAVVLPAATWCETSGTLTNLEGNVREMTPAVEPQGQALPDWQILSLLSRKLGGEPAATLEALSALAAAEIEGRSAAHG
jgi:NADH dehydrogenase/NADH:ubiquinone oxidoreductase subunit G